MTIGFGRFSFASERCLPAASRAMFVSRPFFGFCIFVRPPHASPVLPGFPVSAASPLADFCRFCFSPLLQSLSRLWRQLPLHKGSRRNPFGERISACDKPENLILGATTTVGARRAWLPARRAAKTSLANDFRRATSRKTLSSGRRRPSAHGGLGCLRGHVLSPTLTYPRSETEGLSFSLLSYPLFFSLSLFFCFCFPCSPRRFTSFLPHDNRQIFVVKQQGGAVFSAPPRENDVVFSSVVPLLPTR